MPPTESPQSTPATMPEARKQHGGFGPMFGIIIILVLMLVGAFYFWGKILNERDQNPPPYIPGDSVAS